MILVSAERNLGHPQPTNEFPSLFPLSVFLGKKKRIEEHQRDIRLNKDSTALAQLNKKKEIEIDFKNTKKLANYTNQSCALYREALEIKSNRDACNTKQHAHIDEGWMCIMREQDMRKGEEELTGETEMEIHL